MVAQSGSHGRLDRAWRLLSMTALAMPPVRAFLPVFAKTVLHSGPGAYSILLSCSGLGSVLGALVVAALGNIQKKGLTALLMLLLLGECITVAFAVSDRRC